MDLAADTVTRRGDFWAWRFVCTALSFALFVGGTAISFLAVVPLYLLLIASVTVPAAALAQVRES